jgi:hypothetical protein
LEHRAHKLELRLRLLARRRIKVAENELNVQFGRGHEL